MSASTGTLAHAADMAVRRPDSSASRPSYDQIAELAYQLYLQRGGYHGRDLEDWIEAERELTSQNGR